MGRVMDDDRKRPLARVGLGLLSAAYLAGVWLEGVGSSLPASLLPRTPLYFLQIAALFPHAATNVIDYRAEGWVCSEHRWRELETRPYFPLDPDDKENRFQRVMHFFRDNRPAMHALDDYLVQGHQGGTLPDGIPHDAALGGIRVLSLRLPLPEPGSALERLSRKPLDEYPTSVRKNFYHTTRSKLTVRCGYPPSGEPSPTEAPPAFPATSSEPFTPE